MKCILHLNEGDPEKVSELFGNIKNLKKDERVEMEDIKVVMNSYGAKFTSKDSDAAEFLEDYMDQGVEFLICENSLDNLNLDEEEIVEGLKTVPSGIGSLNIFQDRGYTYIKV